MARHDLEGIPYHIDNVEHYVGRPLGDSDWLEIDQARIDEFASATADMNPMHVDPDWCKENSPFGAPIAHGFLTLSLLSHLSWTADLQPPGVDYGINLGFERVRFLAPVMVGDRVRLRSRLVECKPRGAGRWWFKTRVTIDAEKSKKAILNAIWLILFVNEELAGGQVGLMNPEPEKTLS